MKNSAYLVDKCKNLDKVISYFCKGGSFTKPGTEIKLSFLAQIDFWDWEIEELSFSIRSFEKRSKAWGNSVDFINELNKQGFVVKNDAIRTGTWRRDDDLLREEVVAPVKEFNELLEKWNKLIDMCEKLMDKHSLDKLHSFKKKII